MIIVLASSNPHKVKEINEIVRDADIEFVLPPEGFDPVEDGLTFEENSYKKAYEAWKYSKNWVLADDSGLCIDALDGRPGINSARYDTTPQKRINKVLTEMDGKDNRTARFKCAMTLINPAGEVEYKCIGTCEGSIAKNPSGNNGFGYDPIFVLEGSNKTMAELPEEEKNKISHRANALNNMLEYIVKNVL